MYFKIIYLMMGLTLMLGGTGIMASKYIPPSVWSLPSEISSVWMLPGEIYTPSPNPIINENTKAPDYSHLYYVLD